MTFIFFLIFAFAIYCIVSEPIKKICPNCGFCGTPLTHTPGAFLIEIVLWLAFIIPGLTYTLWRSSNKYEVCPKCRLPGMIPIDSPKGRELFEEYHQKNKKYL